MKIKFILFSILIISVSFPVYSQKDIEKSIKKGLEFMYNFKWEKAEETFRDLITKHEDDPRGYHYMSGIYLWYYLSTKDESDLQTFAAFSDTAIEKAENALEENPEDENLLYTIGSAYSYRAIAFAKAENYVDAIWASNKSESHLSRLIEINPQVYDAYLGLGLYNFAVGQVPSAFKWALSLAGITGEKETGIKYIKSAADKGNYAKVEAQYYCSQIVSEFLNDNATASEYLQNLTRKYPANLLFNYSLASVYIKQRKLNQAEKLIRKILNSEENKFTQISAFSYFLEGDIYFKKNNFDSAIVYYHKFLDRAAVNDYKGIAAFRLAVSYEITGERSKAEKYFLLTNDAKTDIEDDIFARRLGTIYSKRKMTDEEIHLIKGINLIDAGNYKAAYDTLSSLLPKAQPGKLRAEILLNLSEAAYYSENNFQSLNFASEALNEDPETESWIAPFACYYSARVQKVLGDSASVNYYIEKAEDYSNYDYQNRLKNLLYSLAVEDSF